MPEQDPDARIRELVARAVADAPAAPGLDVAPVFGAREATTGQRGRAWWIGGGAAVLAAAAAIVTAVVLVGDTDERVSTPLVSVPPSAAPTVAPTVPPAPTAPASVPVTDPAPTTTATAVPVAGTPSDAESVVMAGADGVAVLVDGVEVRREPTPAVIAFVLPDGYLVVERPQDGGETPPALLTPDGSVDDAPFPVLGDGRRYRLHDVARFGEAPVLLYGVVEEDGAETLYVAQLGDDLGARELRRFEPDAGSVSRLSLSDTGTVVGTLWNASGTSLLGLVVPGSPDDDGTPLDAAELGLDAVCQGDITQCPGPFAISSDGATVAWVEVDELVTHDVGTGVVTRAQVPTLAGSAPLNGLDARRRADGTIEAAVSSELGDAGVGSPDELVRIAADGTPEVTSYPGVTLTLSPYAAAPSVEPTPPPVSTGLLVTAGPNGVGVWDDRTFMRGLGGPAEIALLTPGGAVVFQSTAPNPDAGLGDPHVWRPDGTVEPLLATLPAEQSYRLHDVAEIDGIPTLLYGVLTTPAVIDPVRFVEVLHAVRMDPAGWSDVEVDSISTWEGGWDRLSLSDQGLIVGEHGQEVTRGLYVNAVPGSPAAQAVIDATDLGVEASYSECDDCPGRFTVAQDGTTVAWTEADQVVLHPPGPGEARRWRIPNLVEPAYRTLDVRPRADGSVELIVNSGGTGDPNGPVAVRFVLGADGTVVEEPTDSAFAAFGP